MGFSGALIKLFVGEWENMDNWAMVRYPIKMFQLQFKVTMCSDSSQQEVIRRVELHLIIVLYVLVRIKTAQHQIVYLELVLQPPIRSVSPLLLIVLRSLEHLQEQPATHLMMAQAHPIQQQSLEPL